jgi:heptosyltransferase-2
MINSDRACIVKAESLTKSSAVMKRCKVFVTNDSSQMHIAAALGLKVVAIIGPTNQNYIYPWKTEHNIVSLNLDCSPCFFYSPKPLICKRTDVKFKCIKELTVDMVYNKAENFF